MVPGWRDLTHVVGMLKRKRRKGFMKFACLLIVFPVKKKIFMYFL